MSEAQLPPLVIGNWKQNTTLAEARALAEAVRTDPVAGVEQVVCPPLPWLVPVAEALTGSAVGLGAQTCSAYASGAYTGEVGASMLAELCEYVLVGHSERRALFGETDAVVAEKLRRILEAGLTPVLCVGETLPVREAGGAVELIREQLGAALADLTDGELRRIVVAYEPVWAIGTGVAAMPRDADEMAQAIHQQTHTEWGVVLPMLYGGSVTGANAAALWETGSLRRRGSRRASLRAAEFRAIAGATRRA